MILSQALNAAAGKNMGHPAIVDIGRAWSYKELRDAVGRLSNYYQKDNEYRARIGLLCPNGLILAQSFLALANAGNPVYLINPQDTDENIAADLKLLEITKVLVSNDQLARFNNLLKNKGMKDGFTVVEVDKKRAGEFDTTFQPLPDRPVTENDPVLILRQDDHGNERRYCIFTHKQVYNSCVSIRKFYRLLPTDRFFTKMHWSHPFSLTHSLLLPLFTGATCVADPDSPTMEEFIEYLSKFRVTRYVGPPNFYYQLLKLCASYKYKLPGVKSITIALGSIPGPIRKAFGLLNIPVLQCFGFPEAVWTTSMVGVEQAAENDNAPSQPAAGVKLAVLDANGDELTGDGKRVGRLTVSCPSIVGKYHSPKEPPQNITPARGFRGTWLLTDEIACLEGEGGEVNVTVLGKSGEMILKDGAYYNAEKIDEAANRITGVSEAAGFVYYSKDGKPLFAVAVVRDNPLLQEREILSSLRETLPPQLVPNKVCVVDALPRGLYESVDRIALQKQHSVSESEAA